MFLKRLELHNTGPIEHAVIECKFNDDQSPKPIILVGQNGSGKSVVTAHVVSALIDAHGVVFENSDVEQGKVYKLRSTSYIRYGSNYSTAGVYFSRDFSAHEAQLSKPKKLFEKPLPEYKHWGSINENDSSHYMSNFHTKIDDIREELNICTHLFFPPNRFEEPAWLNIENLRSKAEYASLAKFSSRSNRPIVNYAPMRDLQNWLLDLIYDKFALEKKLHATPLQIGQPLYQPETYFDGPASQILKPIENFFSGAIRTNRRH